MIDIEIKGIAKILKNLTTVKGCGFKGARVGIAEGRDNIQKGAAMYLESVSNSSKWWGGGAGKTMNLDRPEMGINRNWITYPEKGGAKIAGNEIYTVLDNTSPHAHMVEEGTNSPITARGGGKMYFWGGDEYGWQGKWSVRGQPGKHYLRYGIDMSKDWIPLNIGNHIMQCINAGVR